MELIGKINYVKSGVTFEEKYPELAQGDAARYPLQTDSDMYMLLITANFEAERLYYKIQKSDSTFLCLNIPLIEDVNLINGFLPNYELRLTGLEIYFGKLEE